MVAMQVLIVEDDPGVAAVLAAVVQREGWTSRLARGLEDGWKALESERFAMLLLDLSLPDGDGTSLLQRLRQSQDPLPHAKTPVLIITSRSRVGSRIQGLDLGADAYVVKPFHPQEVAALMRALVRRADQQQGLLTWGGVVLDRAAHRVTRDGEPVDLSPAQFVVLQALLEARPRPLSRPEIQARLGRDDADGQLVEGHVHHLRRKLGDALIRTVRGVGYLIPS